MKQHPIPQNILDIEFKLFTKFTVREFVYMALGIGIGGIFIYMYTNRTLPGIVAFPVFAISSAVGLFMGLVPINDQNADIFIRNYFLAITRPTLRVWRNEQFDEKVAAIAEERGIDMTQGSLNRSGETVANPQPKIIGAIGGEIGKYQFIQSASSSTIDQEEEQAFQQLEQINNEINQNQTVAASNPVALNSSDKPQIQIDSIGSQSSTPTVTQSSVISAQPVANADPSEILQQPVPTDTVIQQIITSSGAGPQLVITPETYQQYALNFEGVQLVPNSLNLYISRPDASPIQQATVMLRDNKNRLLQVYQSDQGGYILSNKSLANGEYSIDIEHDGYTFPRIQFILNNSSYPILRINSLN